MQISFQTQGACFFAEFNRGQTANEILKNLPIDSKVSRWGDEIYFETSITAACQDATSDVAVGDVAYWPEGRCICVFFGPTPASKADKPVPATPVVIIGKTATSPDELRKIQAGNSIRVMPVQEGPAAPSYDKAAQFERKLNQSEIDVLVQQLLANKARTQSA